MTKPRINVQVEESQRELYRAAAEKERIPLPVWVRKYLDKAAEEQLREGEKK